MENYLLATNLLNITNLSTLLKEEERLSKKKAKELFASGFLDSLQSGTLKSLCEIHKFLFGDIYSFAGVIREVNISKGGFRFIPCLYLESALKKIELMPQSNFEEIVEKYVEINIAHPFREGNGRSGRIWLDLMLKQELKQVIDWSKIEKHSYMLAMERSVVVDIEIKHILQLALSDKITDINLYMRGVDTSYAYEGYSSFKTEEL